MAKRYSDLELNEMLFEDLPSDDESLSSIDDTDDDQTYVPEPNNNILLVLESDSESDENLEILNIEENVSYILPSPQKNRSSNRRKNPSKCTSNVSSNCRELFPSIKNYQTNEELGVPILTQHTASEVQTFDTNSNFQDEFIEPIWLSNENINMEIFGRTNKYCGYLIRNNSILSF